MVFKLKQDLFQFKVGTKIIGLDGVGRLGQLPWGWEIPEWIMIKNPNWFEDVSFEHMSKEEKLEQIKKHFRNLKECYDWRVKNISDEGTPSEENLKFLKEKMEPAVEKEIVELEKLGVSRDFSTSLFIFGPLVTNELLEESIK